MQNKRAKGKKEKKQTRITVRDLKPLKDAKGGIRAKRGGVADDSV